MVPKNYEHAKQLDNINNNTKWQDSTNIKISQLNVYYTRINHGVRKTSPK